MLFVGKLDVTDIPALAELAAMGMCRQPRFLPPWLVDPRYLLALLTYSTFRSGLDEEPLHEAVRRMLAHTPLTPTAHAAE